MTSGDRSLLPFLSLRPSFTSSCASRLLHTLRVRLWLELRLSGFASSTEEEGPLDLERETPAVLWRALLRLEDSVGASVEADAGLPATLNRGDRREALRADFPESDTG